MLTFELANQNSRAIWQPFVNRLNKEFNYMRGFNHDFSGVTVYLFCLEVFIF
jgi:hypothetical protein